MYHDKSYYSKMAEYELKYIIEECYTLAIKEKGKAFTYKKELRQMNDSVFLKRTPFMDLKLDSSQTEWKNKIKAYTEALKKLPNGINGTVICEDKNLKNNGLFHVNASREMYLSISGSAEYSSKTYSLILEFRKRVEEDHGELLEKVSDEFRSTNLKLHRGTYYIDKKGISYHYGEGEYTHFITFESLKMQTLSDKNQVCGFADALVSRLNLQDKDNTYDWYYSAHYLPPSKLGESESLEFCAVIEVKQKDLNPKPQPELQQW